MIKDQPFENALVALKQGDRVYRAGWNGKEMYVKVQDPYPCGRMTLPYMFFFTADGDRVPWAASSSDLLANDWVILL